MILAILALIAAPAQANWNRVQFSQPDAAIFVATYLHTGMLDPLIPDSGFSYYLTVVYSDYKRMVKKPPLIYSRHHKIEDGSDPGHQIAIKWVKERIPALQREYERDQKRRFEELEALGYVTQEERGSPDDLDEKRQ